MKVVKFIRGSRAYGTENEHSDTDTTTVFVEDIYDKVGIFRDRKYDTREVITDDMVVELGRLTERLIACDSSYFEHCFKDLVIEETDFTALYFEYMDELIKNDLFNESLVRSRGHKHFKKESKRFLRILDFNNLEKTQNGLYQNIRIEMLVESILNGNPKLRFEGKDLDTLNNYKYGKFTAEELREELLSLEKRWTKFHQLPPIKKREENLDTIYVEYLRKFYQLNNK